MSVAVKFLSALSVQLFYQHTLELTHTTSRKDVSCFIPSVRTSSVLM